MKNKKVIKNLIRILVVIALIGVTLWGMVIVSYVMRPISHSRQNFCGFYAEPDNSLDAVMIGSSSCYYAWQPLRGFNEYGFTSYNLGSDALQPQSVEYEVKEIIKTQSPKLLMIDLRPFQYGNVMSNSEDSLNMERVAPFRNVSDNMKYSMNRYEFIHKTAPTAEDEWTYQIDISKYHALISELFSAENWKYAFNSYPLTSKGFWYHYESRVVEFDPRDNKEKITPLNDKIRTMFISLLDTIKSECPDTKVLFLVTPHKDYGSVEGVYNSLYKIIDEYEYDYLNIMDFTDDVGLDRLYDFSDGDHLNLSGAAKVSAFIGKYIDMNYDLPDRRNDSEYENWNECYRIWNEEMSQVQIIEMDYD